MPIPLDPSIRLISPNRLRIYPNAKTGTWESKPGPIVLKQRDGLSPGQADGYTMRVLRLLGWTIYSGPATTDEQGWIIPGSDPNVRPIR